jgi:flavin-dependent dehydrogenase
VTREVLDAWLVQEAVAAGATLVDGVAVAGPEFGPGGMVLGVRVRTPNGVAATYRATMTLGADGRRSTVGQACRLSTCARSPRRWAIGAYFAGVEGLTTLGEMHVRVGHYLGVAPTADGRANACLVQPYAGGGAGWADPGALLQSRLRADPVLGPRFARARATTRATVLGPLAIDSGVPGCAGLLLVGDAAGFVDPMTGDGIRLAFASAELAVAVTLDVLAGRTTVGAAYRSYARALKARVGWKQTFNRAMRQLVSSPRSVGLAARGARVWPGAFRAAIRYAGDASPGAAP